MRPLSLALALAMGASERSYAQDGGLAAIYASCPDASDAGEAVELDGGTWLLPPPRGPRLACRLTGCEEYAASLEQGPPVAPQVVAGTLVGLAIGVVTGGLLWWRFGPTR